jgi:hypothetical protein
MQRMARGGVSQNMKRLLVVVALAGVVLAVWYLRRPHKSAAAPDEARSTTQPAATPARPIDHVTKLSGPAERKQLADRIAAAQAARHTASASSGAAPTHAPAAPKLPSDLPDDREPAISKTQIRDAMREVIGHVQKCYEDAIPTLKEPNLTVTAHIMLSGDPDIGTLIDADQLADENGQPLPATFDDCLRTTFMTLALPPLAEGDALEIHYPFRFESH